LIGAPARARVISNDSFFTREMVEEPTYISKDEILEETTPALVQPASVISKDEMLALVQPTRMISIKKETYLPPTSRLLETLTFW
jgi:hypothetical protein